MSAYRNLKAKLQHTFQADPALATRIAAATTLDEILAALAASYRAWLLTAAAAARGPQHPAPQSVQTAEAAAEAREEALLEVMMFFERTSAAARGTAVRKTGQWHLRVYSYAPEGAG